MTRASGDGSLIAVVGISCRLPHAPDPAAYWRLLERGGDAISELPRERWELVGEAPDAALDQEPGARHGGFLDRVDHFDPALFGISPREAAAMDPQQRLALELAWEALEDGGIAASAIRGDGAGVFLGAIAGDYANLVDRRGPEAIGRHTAIGLHRSIIANRISYVLGLAGPSLTVDAAQSASLVAVHLACESMRRGESQLALAGGVHLNLDPRGALGAARIGGLSPDGRCFTFDARANGFVRGEGGGIVVLKPLASARADGDRVYCVIRGSAVNNDGGGPSLTAPSRAAQEAVLKAAYRRAGVKRSELQYVELHGSGTPAGDPVEAAALGGVLGTARAGSEPLPVGSAKTNIGHLEGAAGIAGLIKVALAIDRRRIPASLNFERPNPKVPLAELGLRVQDESGGWPHADRPLLAGVSSFGVGGTNCHVVLSETLPDSQKKSTKTKNTRGVYQPEVEPPLPGVTPMVLSAASRPALRAQAQRLRSHLDENPQLELADVGFSLATTRSHLRQRAAIVAADRAQLASGLGALAAGEDAEGVVTGVAGAGKSPVFLFPGQGSQWSGMGVELAETSAVFRGYLEECEEALAPHIDFSVRDVLRGVKGSASFARLDVLQPALFAVTTSLARLWRDCGMTPGAVAGHSQGEVAAAYVSGGLSLEDAALVAAVRSRLIEERAGPGGMISVALSPGALEPLLAPFGDRLALAARNGPTALIVAGERQALDRLLADCAVRGIRARDVAGATFPSHSAFAEPLREDVIEALSGIAPRPGDIPFYSTVTGGVLDTRELGPEYWYRNLREPVRFEAVTRRLLEEGKRLFLEICAHPVFAFALEETIEDALSGPEEATVLATLRRDQGGLEHFARSLAEAHVAGAAIDWGHLFPGAKRAGLPTYPFQRQRCWFDDALDEGADEAPAGEGAGLATELAGLPPGERRSRTLALVRGEVAKVLGQDSAESVEPDRVFKDLGFDSAAAADLRKRLRAASGLRIGSTAVFDHPTSNTLARHLLALATGEAGGGEKVTVRAQPSDQPIAIVGMACRLPGASSPRELWRLLAEGVDASSEFPDDRGWDRERLYDPDPGRPDTSYVWRGGFLADAGHFDAEFFDVSPREALAMDPQQRLLLEASWEAFEGAGLAPDGLRGSSTGVFAGISSQDYSAGLRGSGGSVEGYRLTGSATSVASGRISYALGLEGPAITVDTACSSSLVAMHLAAGALRGGECDLALAGGATVLGSPGVFTEFSRQRGLAPDGRCKSFAEAADGTAWAEGVGVLVLERLSDAEANGHPVLATIRGSAVNQDGASNGLTAPNGPAQERVIRQALANAGLAPADVDMVEAHGTGTALGDPIEAGALLATYGQGRDAPLRLGSLKSNIGHAQAAAGVAGAIKAVMAMREATMPKTLHLDAPSSEVEWESGKVELLSEAMPWPAGERPRRAAVSSFGISGTNAHLILEEAPVAGWDPGPGASAKDRDGEQGTSPAPLGGPVPLLVSARSAEALAAQAERLAAHLKDDPSQDPTDLAYSLATTRAQLEQRAVVVGKEREELLGALEALAGEGSSPAALVGKAQPGARLAYLLTGQGSQRPGMGRELFEAYPAYAGAFDAACAEIDPLIGRSLAELVFCEPGSEEAELLDNTTYAQPALFAIQVALHRLLESFGLAPELLCGHSIGEITAAHISAVLSLPDAARLVCARGALMGALPEGGAMLAIEATEAEALASIEGREAELSLAAVNSPNACVLSGEQEAIEQLEAHWRDAGKKTKRLVVSHAFHSPLMEPMLAEFEQVAEGLSYSEPQTPIVSCLNGEVLSAEQATDPAHWVAHVREPVRFADAVRTLAAEGASTYLELGPDPILSAMARECLQGEPTLAPTLRQGRDEPGSVVGALAAAHASGAPVEWSAFFAGTGAKAVPLPTYPFQRKRYWLAPEGEGNGDLGAAGITDAGHPMLGAKLESPDGDGLLFTGRLSTAEQPWIADHVIFDTVLLPGTGFLELALRAAEEVGAGLVEELTLQAPLVFAEDGAVQLQVVVSAVDDEGRRELSIHSKPEAGGEWTRHAAGTLAHLPAGESKSLEAWPPPGAEPVEVDSLYELIVERGLELGPAFHCLTAAWRKGEEVFAEVALNPEQRAEAGRYRIHPVLLDAAAMHTTVLDGSTPAEHRQLGVRLPFSWRNVSLDLAGAEGLRVHAVFRDERDIVAHLADAAGAPVATIESLALRPAAAEQLQGKDSGGSELFSVEWVAASDDPDAGGPSELFDPAAEVAEEPPAAADPAHAARALALHVLQKLQRWLASESEDRRLAILTHGALATGPEESPDPAQAALAGLVGSAASEHPGRFLLIDTDDSEASQAALQRALVADAKESQIALREGELLVPRLVKAKVEEKASALDPERTVLITGATGGLGPLIAKHLAGDHGARRLLLLSRSGPDATGAAELKAELEEMGAEARIAACDASDRGQLEALIADIPSAHPLGAVIHCAAVLADATIESADAEQLQRVFAPKAEAAWHLHELSKEAELTHFVCFSSIAGLLGSPGQGAYAAANRFLDALAQRRHCEGLPATSIAWGLWMPESGMAASLQEADIARTERAGIAPLTAAQGLALFDRALASPQPLSAAVRLERAALRSQAATGGLAAVLAGLVPTPARSATSSSLAARLAEVPQAEREEQLRELVRAEVAAVLGHDGAAAVDPEKAFKDLGFDSLAAVELRNRLKQSTGLRLASTVVFDHPTAVALAGHLLAQITVGGPARKAVVRAQASEEPIAIVGMGCHLPGGVDSPEQLWRLVVEERDAIVPFPEDRGWDLERIYDPDPEHLGTSYVREGGFLVDPASFDAEFFAIAPREATAMDPQQRLLLQTSWEALEDAGIVPGDLKGEPAGVFTGAAKGDYSSAVEGYKMVGGMASILAGRIAYTLGLEGPAISLDTACSSSLVAMHLAIGALHRGECSLALAGGVTVHATPAMFVDFSRQRVLSPDGRSKSFAAEADGAAWSEGVGMLVLERLSEAERNGRRILATIRGSAINQDGASNGLTAPNGPSQERVIRQALANAGLEPADIDMVEAHGTGTALGDPIEAGALIATYGRERERPLRLGSLKSNIGHTLAAAGVAGVIKATMAMRAGLLPKTLHADHPSPAIDWDSAGIELLTEPLPWESDGRPRRAAVSSFGISGTNAHVILEGRSASSEPYAPREEGGKDPGAAPWPGPLPVLLSARTQEALVAGASRLAAHLRENPELELADLAYSLATSRTQLDRRAVAVAAERGGALAALESLAGGEPDANTRLASVQAGTLAYLLTGQGSQRPGMGRELFEAYPAYAGAFDAACAEIDPLIGRSLAELVFCEPGSEEAELLDNTTYAQPALFAIQVALHRLLESFGLAPELLCGHSIGEITAAHISAVLSLPDAARLVCARGALMGALPEGGAMLAIEATEAEALASIEGREAELSLAAVNSPNACVLSGEQEAIEQLEAHWRDAGKKTKRLVVSHAFHSPLMEPMLAEFEQVAEGLSYSEPQTPIVSCLNGEVLSAEQATDPAHWVAHVREPVRFADAVRTLAAEGASTYLELGPDPILSAMAHECLPEGDGIVLLATLREGRPEPESVIESLATAHAHGAAVQWSAFFAGTGAKAVPLPTYPFQGKRYWLAPGGEGSGDLGAAGITDAGHPMLGAKLESPDGDGILFTGRLSTAEQPWIADHVIFDTVLLPGTGFLELALRAAEEVGAGLVEELTLQAPLVFAEDGAVQLQVVVSAVDDEGRRELSIHSKPEAGGEWTRHAAGTLAHLPAGESKSLEAWPPPGAEPVEVDSLYELIVERGLELGPAFQGVNAAWRKGEEVFAEVALPTEQRGEAGRYCLHPALLDAALHPLALTATTPAEHRESGARLPFSWRNVSLDLAGAEGLRVHLDLHDDWNVLARLADAAGTPVATIESLALRPVRAEQVRGAGGDGLFAVEWVAAAPSDPDDGVLTGLFEPPAEPNPDVARAARAAALATLEKLQDWLAEQSSESLRLAILTHGALATGPEESPDPAQAALAGLVGSAASEHPGRFLLIDTDDSEASQAALQRALVADAKESQIALREGELLVPRLVKAKAEEKASGLDPERTVLITGATGGLGPLIARHLVDAHGARRLLLVSRSGPDAPGAGELRGGLQELGAEVEIAACDASDRGQLEALIAEIPSAHPLGAVIHCAGALADATIESADAEQFQRVFAPKAEAAWHLHELTEGLDLSHFVLFSSIAGLLGSPGQAGYAAANCFLDALAQRRHCEGLPATSIAWGLWMPESGMAASLQEADIARTERAGIAPLTAAQGLALFDRALAGKRALSAAVRFERAALRSQAATGGLAAVLAGLVPTPARSATSSSLAALLAEVPEAEREQKVRDLVRSEVAAVLGHETPQAIDSEKAFKDLGFDSLAAVELRNRLKQSTGLRLASTTVFDHPTTVSLASHLLARATASGPVSKAVVRARASEEPIAIVGMGCHLPGADSPEQLWELVAAGRDAISPFPEDRGWDLERIYDPDPEHLGTSYVREGGFLGNAGSFDAEFFAIAPREATAMDPQQRLLLETSWEALEDAGIDPASLRGEPAGVFAGGARGDYSSAVEGYKMIGGQGSVLAGRISYTLGLEGPALAVDTACSSSLVAMHLAIGALHRGECSLALAGGVTVHATPVMFVDFSRQRALSPDGRSKSFAEAANGAGWSEGVGMLVLERLSEAERNGHRVLATIRGSAVNQDGASNGLTAPSGPSQERVIRQALVNAGLEPADVDMVEAHGTGTTLGDPVEAGALIATYGKERTTPLRLGSLKSNIGHTLGAAGVAGVIKAVMAMREGTMPKTLHADEPSSRVDWAAGKVELLSEPVEWEAEGRPRRAAVSSFGMSGTNAHLILEQPPAAVTEAAPEGSEGTGPAAAQALPGVAPLLLSARTEPGLRARAEQLAARLRGEPALGLTDVAYSLATERAFFAHRAAVVGASRDQSLQALDALAASAAEAPCVVRGSAEREAKVAFLFPGQGSQWQGMALGLLESSPVFARGVAECEEALEPHLDFALGDVLRGTPGAASMERVEVVQPALFAVMVSLARLWRACGLEPAAVAGHSQGEIAAAHVAGGLSLDDAARVIAVRSRLIATLAGQGQMVSLIAPRERAEALLEPWAGEIEVAAYNGPSSMIVSGAQAPLDELLARCAEEGAGVRARPVAAGIAASHSRHVEVLRGEILSAFAGISPRSGSVPFHSTVTGEVLDTAELGAEYWYRNARQPVLFEQVSRGLVESGHGALIEVSAHPVFAFAVRETIERSAAGLGGATVIETLRRDEGGPERFAMSLAVAHAAGAPLDWEAFFAGSGASAVPLPTYPFQRKRYWLAPTAGSVDPGALGQRGVEHPFLAAAIEEPEGDAISFGGRVSIAEHPWLADHAVLGTAILPGTAFLELALCAGAQAGTPVVEELTLQAPLPLSEVAARLRVSLAAADGEGRREIAIHSCPEDAEEGQQWTRHANGVLSAQATSLPDPLPAWPPAGAEPIGLEDLRARLAEAGSEYGPAFGGLSAAWRLGEEVYAEVSLPESAEGDGGFALHPALLDAALHPVALGAGEGVRLPFAWSGVSLPPSTARELRARLSGGAEEGARIELFDGIGMPIGRVESLVARRLDPGQMRGAAKLPLFLLGWQKPLPSAATAAPAELFELSAPLSPGAGAAREAALAALDRIQSWLASESGDSRLAILTEAALAVGEGESSDPAAAAAWGLVRSAASEHPGRFCLIDTDGSEASRAVLAEALATGESQLALREGELLVPRLGAVKDEGSEGDRPFDPDRTVLVSGGTGGLGALVARHLVEVHGVRRLLLASRSGEWARGQAELPGVLRELGAEVTVAACDVSDRGRLAELIDSIPAAYPLGAVIHCAAVLEDATVQTASAEQLGRVFAPKVDGAWHLHELTAGLELSHFVCFSSISGIVGSPGQGAYAAANCFLDALAARRRAEGLPGTSIAWGLWQRESGMGADLGEADFARMRRAGILALTEEQGLALFDATLARPESFAAAVRFDRAALAAAQGLAAPLEGLVPASARGGATAAGVLALRLRQAPATARGRLAEDFVRAEVAAILGHASATAIGPNDAFKDLGFDSLAAVELRNRLNLVTGLQLPATVVFDYPDAAALSGRILAQVVGGEGARPAPARARSSREPIAIVGMACRYPGGVSSPAGLWQLIQAGDDAIAELPTDRGWDPASIYVLDPERPDLTYTHAGGFLADAAEFDPAFFSISPREAIAIDPQQRLALESSWEALEDAGIDPHGLRGSLTGVFCGVMHHDYGVAVSDTSGMATSAASGRVSYALGLEGPAITIDTACSSSLVATHLAAGALRGGECDLALAGGSTVLARPSVFGYFSRQQGLARDGRCKAFSEEADGVGISEGVGVLVLERLADAEANGHRVLATIRGSAVNQDGASNGLTAPNGPAQERAIRQALANAGLEPADVDMVEAHGTGTALGDPIEAGALLATYGQDREQPLRLGSLKSNIGHTQAAAGVGGVIKAVMAMREGVMPKTLHAEEPSSKVDWAAGKVELLTESIEWEANGRPRRAAVSSFGASGTNSHLILEGAPAQELAPAPAIDGPLPFLLSARDETALAAQAERLAIHLREVPQLGLGDLAYSLAGTRAQLEQRAVAVAGEREELLATLDALARGEQPPGAIAGRARPGAALAYLFSGQGSQRAGMGKELHDGYPAYAAAFDAACAEIDPQIGRSLAELVFCEPGSGEAVLLAHTTYAQPALFATEVALYRLLESWGLAPALLAGHSVGEIAAAHVAGVLSLPDAAKLVCARGALMGALPEGGAMLAIEASEAEALASIAGKEEEVSLAAVNSPASCVVSGAAGAIEALAAEWGGQGRKCKRLAVSHAFHSPLMEPMLAEFAAVATSLSYAEPRTPIVSCLSGEPLAPERATDPAYWVAHVREPVRFAEAVGSLRDQGAIAFLELGPDPVLCAMARECLGEDSGAALAPALRQGRGEAETLLAALGAAHAAGVPLDRKAFFAGSGARAVPLPTYAFQRKPYWLAAAAGPADPTALGQRPIEHPFLAAAIEEPEGDAVSFSGRVSLGDHPWLADHAVLGSTIFPGTGLLELALRAGIEAGTPTVEELALQAPLVLLDGAVQLRVSLSGPGEDGRREIAIHSCPEEAVNERRWTRNATGVLSPQAAALPDRLPAWPPAAAEPIALEDLRARLAEAGVEYGPAFGGLGAAWRVGEEVYAEVSLPRSAEGAEGFALHPALLDAALHPIALGAEEGIELPFALSGVSLAGGTRELRVRLSEGDGSASLALFDAGGAPIGQVASLTARPLDPKQLRGRAGAPLYELSWQRPAPSSALPIQTDTWRAPEAGEGAGGAREVTLAGLAKLQDWLASAAADSRLAILTRAALATEEGESPDLAQAALGGLVRSAASEHPGRFLLLDSDGTEASEAALERALAADPRETQIALREGELLVPRLAAAKDEEGADRPLDPDRTVLISGATGGLGALVARHLVEAHGARHLLLVSRSGEWARGAVELRRGLQELGAEVTLAATDVSDRSQLEDLLERVPKEHPLGAVIHCAAVLDDGLLESLDQESLEKVFAPKADAAWHLHELTAGLDLSHFVCFSSIAGLLGSPAQANYAAANAFLDALAARRQTQGLAASSIAWGLWIQESGMVSQLGEVDRARMRRAGIEELSEQPGLALFDRVLAGGRALSAAVRFDRAALRAQATAGGLAAVLEGVAGPRVKAGAGAGSSGALSRRLREAPEAARRRLVEDFVRAEVAAILGHASAEAVGPNDAFKDLGFDSLAAIELRNRLGVASGRRLTASVVFDYPTAAALAAYLVEEGAESAEPSAADLEGNGRAAASPVAAQLAQASDEELLEFIDAQVGSDLG